MIFSKGEPCVRPSHHARNEGEHEVRPNAEEGYVKFALRLVLDEKKPLESKDSRGI